MAVISLTKPEYLAAASVFASRNETRRSLCGVHLTRAGEGGVLLVAADGDRLVVFRDCDGHVDADCIVPVSRALFQAARFRGMRPCRRLEADGDVLRVMDPSSGMPPHRQPFEVIDEPYPDWRQVVPQIDAGGGKMLPAVNIHLLALFARVIDAAFGTWSPAGIRVVAGEEDHPVLVTSSHADWFGVISPMKGIAAARIPFSIGMEDEAA